MFQTQAQLEKPAANVVNEVEVLQIKINLDKIEICLTIITILIGLNFVRKRYSSRANELDKI